MTHQQVSTVLPAHVIISPALVTILPVTGVLAAGAVDSNDDEDMLGM